MRNRSSLAAAALAALMLSAPLGSAQPAGPLRGVPQSAVIVLDRDELFARSLFGQRVAADIEAALSALAAENARIQTELEAEERALTQEREEMDPADFRDLATDFDQRVTEIRRTQDAKERAIAQQGERAQQVFLERANPVLIALAQETGALVILDRRMVIASADQVDITEVARGRIDDAIGAGDPLDGNRPEPRPHAAPGESEPAAIPPDMPAD
ncbi:Outer membrane protein [Jannaschia seosinensis]|uniref:Outer membrane protein n=1 Tax=Jannaschia seosinensis TaxID=313367 RepID=A0A0M7BF62_9RHOB|nr:OmpH family outer membrane protein [Jannaschia seosinensis]CUH41031.1 Outer membrane protein [Jannaschia seosinensis]